MSTKNIKESLERHIHASSIPFQGKVDYDASLSKCTYYRIGGPASILITPKSFHDLEVIHQVIQETGTRFFVLGWGSNLLFSDSGFPGVVIRLKHLFTQIEVKDAETLTVGAGVGCSSLLKKAQENGWGGLAHLTGIPGSVGGMIVMNAGTHLGEMKKTCMKVRTVNLTAPGSLKIIENELREDSFSYRHNHFLSPGDLIVDADLRYETTEPIRVKAQIEELYLRRKQTQPVEYPSCGSVFMNPKETNLSAWQVVDQLGLRGFTIGKAQISQKHSNFIINLGDAKAIDVISLIELVKQRAKDELGIEMHEEVKVIA